MCHQGYGGTACERVVEEAVDAADYARSLIHLTLALSGSFDRTTDREQFLQTALHQGRPCPAPLTRSRGAAAVAARLARAAAAVDLPADGTAYAPEARGHAEQPVGRPVGGGARGGARGADGGCGEDGRRDGVLPTDGESA